MEKKIALILGGNGGIGCAAAKRLADDGMQVCATYLNNKDQIEKIANKKNQSEILTYQCNLSEQVEIENLINEISLSFGKIDVVVLSMAAKLKNCQILDLEWQEYKTQYELQIKTMHFVIKALAKQIRKKTMIKFIVLLTEYCLATPPKGISHYVTSKYAAMGMAKTMSVELAQYNCTVNMISPGMVETPFLSNLPAKLIEMTAYNNPLKRIAVSEDISNTISFLASEQSNYINGANLVINGGGVLA